jgi:hypothetical protein
MSTLEDARKLVQDIVSPDLKALSTRVDALEANMKQRFDSVEKLAEARHDLMLLRMDAGFASSDAKSAAGFAAVEARFAATDAKSAAGFAAIEARLVAADAKSAAEFVAIEARFAAADARFEAILKAINVDRRLELLEAAQSKESSRGELHA